MNPVHYEVKSVRQMSKDEKRIICTLKVTRMCFQDFMTGHFLKNEMPSHIENDDHSSTDICLVCGKWRRESRMTSHSKKSKRG